MYSRFRLCFHVPKEWTEECRDVHKFNDFLTLAAGVRLYGLFDHEACHADQYFLEHKGVVAEVKYLDNFNFLLQRRPDIPTILNDDYDRGITNGEMIVSAEGDSQLEVDFRLGSRSDDDDDDNEEEEKENEEEASPGEDITIKEVKVESKDENPEPSNIKIEFPQEEKNEKGEEEEDESIEMAEPLDLSIAKKK